LTAHSVGLLIPSKSNTIQPKFEAINNEGRVTQHEGLVQTGA
jgi:maleate cis-trans isomerase